jgi:sarcosine oxidase subunit delta
MIRIPCPICGLRPETEFTYGGDASQPRPSDDDTSLEAWVAWVFERDNPRGAHLEHWHHVQGCRQWLTVERDTLTHAVGGARLAREAAALAEEPASMPLERAS